MFQHKALNEIDFIKIKKHPSLKYKESGVIYNKSLLTCSGWIKPIYQPSKKKTLNNIFLLN